MKIKIKQLFDEITRQKVYPLTTLKAVRDPKSKKALDEMLLVGEEGVEAEEVAQRDADLLGGKYSAGDIDRAVTFDSEETEEIEEVEILDADRLGGRYTAEDIDAIDNKVHTDMNIHTPQSTGYSSILDFIRNDLWHFTMSVLTVHGFSDLPRTDWGYTLEFYNVGTKYARLHCHLSNDEEYIREVGADFNWISDWSKISVSSDLGREMPALPISSGGIEVEVCYGDNTKLTLKNGEGGVLDMASILGIDSRRILSVIPYVATCSNGNIKDCTVYPSTSSIKDVIVVNCTGETTDVYIICTVLYR